MLRLDSLLVLFVVKVLRTLRPVRVLIVRILRGTRKVWLLGCFRAGCRHPDSAGFEEHSQGMVIVRCGAFLCMVVMAGLSLPRSCKSPHSVGLVSLACDCDLFVVGRFVEVLWCSGSLSCRVRVMIWGRSVCSCFVGGRIGSTWLCRVGKDLCVTTVGAFL